MKTLSQLPPSVEEGDKIIPAAVIMTKTTRVVSTMSSLARPARITSGVANRGFAAEGWNMQSDSGESKGTSWGFNVSTRRRVARLTATVKRSVVLTEALQRFPVGKKGMNPGGKWHLAPAIPDNRSLFGTC